MICAGFFLGMINDSFSQDAVKRTLMVSLIFALFGGLLFYATRVGDGKQVFRFSAVTLIIMVLPALYVILASAVTGLPLHEQIASRTELSCIAAVIFGYGLPYTFLSGYELEREEKKKPAEETQAAAEETDAQEADVAAEETDAQEDYADEDTDTAGALEDNAETGSVEEAPEEDTEE